MKNMWLLSQQFTASVVTILQTLRGLFCRKQSKKRRTHHHQLLKRVRKTENQYSWDTVKMLVCHGKMESIFIFVLRYSAVFEWMKNCTYFIFMLTLPFCWPRQILINPQKKMIYLGSIMSSFWKIKWYIYYI